MTEIPRSSRWVKLAMLAAVPFVFLLAYFDLRREQELSLADFCMEQEFRARFLAATLEARMARPTGGKQEVTDLAVARLLDGLAEGPGATGRAPLHVLLVDDAHRWVDVGVSSDVRPPEDGKLPWRGIGNDSGALGEVGALLVRMEAGEHGAMRLGRPAAESLGLDRRMAAAGFAPVEMRHDRRWSVAVVASARRMRDRARLATWRLAAATGLAGFLVGAFGLVVIRQDRRAGQLAEALRLANATAALQRDLARAEKLATIGTLAAGVAHEVGTPLGIISGRAEQLLGRLDERQERPGSDDSEPMRKGLVSIVAQVDKVSTTIRQLLDFARVRPVETQAVTPSQALGTAAALLDHRFRQAGVRLDVDAPTTVPAVAADPGQLEQVLVNLLLNACDACSPGGRVRARAIAPGLAGGPDPRVRIEIVDDGAGIAPEHLPHVLDPFFTTKKRGQGTGLGLSIAADIVKNHGGTLEIESELGRGTTVRVLLPIAEKEAHGGARTHR